MDTNRLQELAGKEDCEAETKILSEVVPDHFRLCQRLASSANSNQLKLADFDDDSDWSEDQSANDSALATSAAGAELRRTSVAKATEMEVVSPLVRSIFEGRKKLILDASQKSISKKQEAGGCGQSQTRQVPQKDRELVGEEYEKLLDKKVQSLDEEITIFKKESKRIKDLAKEHEEGLARLAREKADWEQQKKNQMLSFQAQQEEQIEKLKKERQILDHRSVTLNILPAVQRKDVEELKETLAKEREEHRGKEMRLRLTINRLRAMNEDLTKQGLEMQDEIRRYESCLLSSLDGRGNGLHAAPFSKRPCGDANHTHSCVPPKHLPPEVLRGGRSSKSSRQCSMEENCDALASLSIDGEEHFKSESTPNFLSEQAKLLSDLFSQPWKVADCAARKTP